MHDNFRMLFQHSKRSQQHEDLIVCKAFVPTNRFNWIEMNGIVFDGGMAAFFLNVFLSLSSHAIWLIHNSISVESTSFSIKSAKYFSIIMTYLWQQNNNALKTRTCSLHFSEHLTRFCYLKLKEYLWYFYLYFIWF